MIDLYSIGQRIYEGRKHLNMSREKFAERLGLSFYYVGQIERGTKKMSFDTLLSVSECLHVSLDYLVYGNREEVKSKDELISLIDRCSDDEVNLITDVLKAAMPYFKHTTR